MVEHPYKVLKEAQEKRLRFELQAEAAQQLPKGQLRRRAAHLMHRLAERLEPATETNFVRAKERTL